MVEKQLLVRLVVVSFSRKDSSGALLQHIKAHILWSSGFAQPCLTRPTLPIHRQNSKVMAGDLALWGHPLKPKIKFQPGENKRFLLLGRIWVVPHWDKKVFLLNIRAQHPLSMCVDLVQQRCIQMLPRYITPIQHRLHWLLWPLSISCCLAIWQVLNSP